MILNIIARRSDLIWSGGPLTTLCPNPNTPWTGPPPPKKKTCENFQMRKVGRLARPAMKLRMLAVRICCITSVMDVHSSLSMLHLCECISIIIHDKHTIEGQTNKDLRGRGLEIAYT